MSVNPFVIPLIYLLKRDVIDWGDNDDFKLKVFTFESCLT